MQRLPLCACEKQTGREPGGWVEAMEASAKEARAWREPMFTPGRAVLSSLSHLCFPFHCKCYLTKAITLILFPVGSILL